jgi:hypothetical protein
VSTDTPVVASCPATAVCSRWAPLSLFQRSSTQTAA